MKLLLATSLTMGLLVSHQPSTQVSKQYSSIVMTQPTRTQLQAYAFQGLSTKQRTCLNRLWQAESSWRYWATNKQGSTAYGIAQVLRTPKHLTPYQQIDRGLRYIEHRYQTPCQAWSHHQHKGWY